MRETNILQRIRVALSDIGARLFRNQVGRYQSKDGSWQQVGLCKGSSDLIGWNTIEITEDMVGRRVAVFTAVEVKTRTGKVTPEQSNFLDRVDGAGGIAVLARSEAEAVEKVETWRP